jgi:hypothetical protein
MSDIQTNNEQAAKERSTPVTNQTIYVNQQEKNSNGMGVAGFVLALIALFLSWVPVLGWILWVLGLIFSLVGVFRKPKGLAIAGLVISFIGLIILIVVLAAIGTAMATM